MGNRCTVLVIALFLRVPVSSFGGPLQDGATLEVALKQWSAAKGGPLIAVEPGNAQPYDLELIARDPGAAPRDRPRSEPPASNAPLPSVVAYFGRKIMPVGTLSVVAPVDMKVLNTKLGAPDILSGLPRTSCMRLLAASLTSGQWRRLAGTDGLSISDLNRDQQALFLKMLPDPFTVVKGEVKGGSLNTGRDRITLQPNERARVRLRMNRRLRFSFPGEDGPNTWISFNEGRLHKDGQQVLILDSTAFRGSLFRRDAYGATLAYSVPNKPKPGQLRVDAESLDKSISLLRRAGVPSPAVSPTSNSTSTSSDPALTVATLIQRAAATSGLELYADARVAGLPVWTAGRSARAGDVLKALCLAVTGTFRKVGPAYVLTDDLEGIGTRVCRIDEWLMDASTKEARLLRVAEEAVNARESESPVPFASDADLPLPADRLNSLKPAWDRRYDGGRMDVGIGELPSSWQARLRGEVDRGNAMIRPSPMEHAVRAMADRVRLSVTMNLSYVIPGVGTVDEGLRGGMSYSRQGGGPPYGERETEPEAGAVELPAASIRALHVSPPNGENVALLAAIAKQRGFTHLWLELPESGGEDLLTAARKACEEQHLALVPVVRLLFRPAAATSSVEKQLEAVAPDADLNILGETASTYQQRRAPADIATIQDSWRERYVRRGDWLRIDNPEFRAAAAKRITEVAPVPGIAGLVLRDTSPPGYRDSGKGQYPVTGEGWDFGFTPRNRLAFLRERGVDPIDIPSLNMGTFSGKWDLPFFPSDRLRPQYAFDGTNGVRTPARTIPEEWNAYRYAQNRKWMAGFYQEIRASAPALPLIVEGQWSVDATMVPARFVAWEKAGSLPDFSYDGPALKESEAMPAILGVSHLIWRLAPPPGYQYKSGTVPPLRKDEPTAFFREVARTLSPAGIKRAGIVIDLSDLPAERVMEFVRSVPPLR